MGKIITVEQKQKWRNTYRKNRYLFDFSTEDVKIRLEDILLNLLEFSNKGNPFFYHSSKNEGLVERCIHVEEELNIRGVTNLPINNPNQYLNKYPNVRKAIKAMENKTFSIGQYLVKYGKKEHLRPMKDNGRILINPASFYNDSSLNNAIHDYELSQNVVLPQGSAIRKKNNNGRYEALRNIKSISVTNKYETDFYIYCMGTTYQHRLFDDFEADSCLIIHDVPRFLGKFLKNIRKNYSDWQIKDGNIKYYDPFFPKPNLDIPFNKHFKYWCQSEYRIAFKPQNPVEKLESINMEIGSLNDCSELILL